MLYESIDLSASQIETFRDCARKWAWYKIDGIKAPSGAAADLGTAVHLILEEWQRDGKSFDVRTREGKIAIKMLQHLPPPKTPGVEVEQEFNFQFYNIRMRGRIDWRHMDRDPRPLIGDHKTTSDFKWAKSSDDLLDDIQAAAYAFDAMIKTGCKDVDLQWTYGTTGSTPQARPVLALITQDHVSSVLSRVHEIGQEILVIKNNFERAIDVPPDATACDKYGGCPHRERCNLSAQEKRLSVFSQIKNVTLADEGKLREQEKSKMAKSTKELLAELKNKPKDDTSAPAAAPAKPPPAVNAGDPPPPPPPAKQIDGKWVMPVYDENKGEWSFPGDPPPAAAPAAEPAKKPSLLNRIPKPPKPSKEEPAVDLDAPEKPNQDPEPRSAQEAQEPAAAIGALGPSGTLIGKLPAEIDYEKLADMVAKRVISQLASALHLVNK